MTCVPYPASIQENEEDVLPSFASIKQNVLQTLYGNDSRDKSPKGSVDVDIRPLVDLINSHPSFATLSSCSGRITLFDPNRNKSVDTEDSNTNDGDLQTASGKGTGGWLLSSHEELEQNSLSRLLSSKDTESMIGGRVQPLVFKHEPLLLHVAASTLSWGRKLLSLALGLGFRESGLVVSDSRVTVAIRGVSSSLAVPLTRHGKLRPSDAYLHALVEDANHRMRINQSKLERLQEQVKATFFESEASSELSSLSSNSSVSASFVSIPPLNLWGHAAVAISSETNDTDVFVFGGYGCGPFEQNHKACRRLNHVYRLSRQQGVWQDHWTRIQSSMGSEQDVQIWYGVKVSLVKFTAREGLGACVLPTPQTNPDIPLVALWGGRAGPAAPCGSDLFLFSPSSGNVATPSQVHGQPPSPRWGHTMTALSSDADGCLALVMGGRNAETSMDDSIYILSLSGEKGKHFAWEKLNDLVPRFHHTSFHIHDSILVFGGLSDPHSLVEPFSRDLQIAPVSAFALERCNGSITTVRQQHVSIDSKMTVPILFGASACSTTNSGLNGSGQQIVVLSGGVPCQDQMNSYQDTEPLCCFTVAKNDNDTVELTPCKIQISNAKKDVDFGSMVHHVALSVPCTDGVNTEMLLLGGGVLAFAFGTSFAKNYRVQFHLDNRSCLAARENSHKNTSRSTVTRNTRLPLKKKIEASNSKGRVTHVLYVSAKNAKTLKTALENEDLIDKTFRMTKAYDRNNGIAVPVVDACLSRLSESDPPWKPLVLGDGQEEVPYSTVILGQARNKKT